MVDDRLREILSLALFAAALFLAAALLTYRETLPGDPGGVTNVCGPVGATLAGFLLSRFGFAAWIAVLLLFRQGVRVFRRAEEESSWGRWPGIALFALVLAATLSHLFEGASTTIPDPGGEVGLALESLLLDQAGLGALGGRLTLLFLLATTFVLASGILYSDFMVSLAGWWEQRSTLRSWWSGGDDDTATAVAEPRKRARKRAPVEEPPEATDEDDETEDVEDGAEVEWEEDAEDGEWDEEEEDGEWDEEAEEEVSAEHDEEELDEGSAEAPEPWDDLEEEVAASASGTAEDDDRGEDEDYGLDVALEAEEEVEDDEEWVDASERRESAADREDFDRDGESSSSGLGVLQVESGEPADDVTSAGEEPDATADDADDATVDLESASKPIETEFATSFDDEEDDLEGDDRVEGTSEESGSASVAEDESPSYEAVKSQGGDGLVLVDPEGSGAGERDEERVPYVFPPTDLLKAVDAPDAADVERNTHEVARKLVTVLASFKIEAKVVGVQSGPSIRMFEIELAAGTKLGRLRSLEDDLAMNLAASSVRIVAPIPGRSTAGIELPNEDRETVTLRELLEWPRYVDRKFAIPFFLGKGSAGQPLVADLAAMPHLLVAGATGAGKSVCLNTMIMSLLYKRSPEQVQMILIDPKMVELSLFKDMPHLMCPVVTDMKRAAGILEWAVEKMEARYHLLHEVGVRNIQAYNRLGDERLQERLGDAYGEHIEGQLPYIVIVIDELADLMMVSAKDVEQSITRLAQKSRAVGIHVVLATQRPSTNVLTGLIKANLPTRIAFRVASKIDSRVILDTNGAEKLLGAGDMLFLPPKAADLVRVQGTFVDDDEIHDVMSFVAANSKQCYSRELMQKRSSSDKDPSEVDELFDDAAKFVVETKRGSASLLQRRYQIGYTRASRLIDLMASEGLLGDYRGSQAREVLITAEELEVQRTEALARLGKKGGGGPGLYDEQESES